MATQSVRIAGLQDLLIGAHDHKDTQRAELAANNVCLPIDRGIAAIGQLMFSAAGNKDYPPSMSVIEDVGCLLSELGELSGLLRDFGGLQAWRKEWDAALKAERAARSA